MEMMIDLGRAEAGTMCGDAGQHHGRRHERQNTEFHGQRAMGHAQLMIGQYVPIIPQEPLASKTSARVLAGSVVGGPPHAAAGAGPASYPTAPGASATLTPPSYGAPAHPRNFPR